MIAARPFSSPHYTIFGLIASPPYVVPQACCALRMTQDPLFEAIEASAAPQLTAMTMMAVPAILSDRPVKVFWRVRRCAGYAQA